MLVHDSGELDKGAVSEQSVVRSPEADVSVSEVVEYGGRCTLYGTELAVSSVCGVVLSQWYDSVVQLVYRVLDFCVRKVRRCVVASNSPQPTLHRDVRVH